MSYPMAEKGLSNQQKNSTTGANFQYSLRPEKRSPMVDQNNTSQSHTARGKTTRLPKLIGAALTPVPLILVQPVLKRLVRDIAKRRPELFERLGPHTETFFMIEVDEFPFVLRLLPDPKRPKLTAHRRHENIEFGASIGGPFMTLFTIIDGNSDSDAMFFSRDVRVGGNTEAAVCLRNAMDDLEGSVVDDILDIGGPLFAPLRLVMAHLRTREAAI